MGGWSMSSLAPEEIAGLGFEAVVRNAPVAIGVIAASGRVIYSNARMRDLTSRQLGYEMPAHLDGGIDIFHPDGRRYDQREWPAVRSITSGEELLDGADAGVFVHPPREAGVRAVTLDTSPMVVVMAVGHRLAQHRPLSVADVLDEPFPGATNLRPDWSAFWTLDEQRGHPAERTDDDITGAEPGLQVVAAGRAIATVPEWVASGLAHPGVVAVPLKDGPPVTTCLLWRADEENPFVLRLVELAAAWTRDRQADAAPDVI
jgi:hypothetical protein